MDGLQSRIAKLTSLLDIARAMTQERDLDRLLHLVVEEASRVMEAERSSILIYDRDRDEIWSRVAQGTDELRFPASMGIAGAVVKQGEVVNLADAYEDERFNRQFDQQTGFRTRALLTVPMRNAGGDIVGALQTLNKVSGAFDDDDVELLSAFAGLAAAAITNATLHQEIGELFEGFARAAVVAIESRDPSTAGHSGRVAEVSCELARAVEVGGEGRWSKLSFTRDEMQELRYAALLHDFGKVGVSENVLVKAEKLYPADLAVVEARFEAIRQSAIARSSERKFALLRSARLPPEALEAALNAEDRALRTELEELDRAYDLVLQSNKPTVLPEGSFESLRDIAARTWVDSRGTERNLLLPNEVELLSIRRGSLSEEERREIESHVTHTFNFLSQIPWTRALRRVPEIAHGHHEKLTGGGYPLGLEERDIPVQTRIITISDIYDALTAADRPYKRALPHEKALDILSDEARQGLIDTDLLRVFIEAQVAERVHPAGRRTDAA